MISLLLLALLVVYIRLWWWCGRSIVRLCQKTWQKVVIALACVMVASGILFGDVLVNNFRFKAMCEKDAGVKIFETRTDVDGIVVPAWEGRNVKKYGYKFLEDSIEEYDSNSQARLLKNYRYTLSNNGAVKKEEVQVLAARYEYRTELSDINAVFHKYVEEIVDRRAKTPLARGIRFTYVGSWIERTLLPMPAPVDCPADPSKHLYHLISQILIPAK